MMNMDAINRHLWAESLSSDYAAARCATSEFGLTHKRWTPYQAIYVAESGESACKRRASSEQVRD